MGKNVAVFVDVANIFYAAKAAGVDIDYVTLLKSATAGRDFVRAYAYTGLDPDNENQRNFHQFLARHQYKVVSKDIRKYGDGKVKANLDIELVVDMMKTARNLDVAVVVSGDGDFAPAIRAVQEMGVRVEVISFRGNTSSDLIEVADLFTDIAHIAKVDKGSTRSGRRVAEDDDEDLSMTEVPDKMTEGSGRGRGGRGRGRGRDRDEVAPARGRGRDRDRVRDRDREEAPIAASGGGQLIALPGEKLSRAAVAAAGEVQEEPDELEEPEEATGEIADADGGLDSEGRRRRRRRGGRGRGRGRREGVEGEVELGEDGEPIVAAEGETLETLEAVGEDEEAAPAAAAEEPAPRAARGRSRGTGRTPSGELPTPFDDMDALAAAPRAPRSTPFGSIWDRQLGTTARPAADLAPLDEEDLDEPEIPEYLLAERRRGQGGQGQGNRGGRGGGGRGGARSAYVAAIERERYGGARGTTNRFAEPPARGGTGGGPSRGGQGGGRGGQLPPRGPRPDRTDRAPRGSGGQEWSEVPPELEELLRAQMQRSRPSNAPAAPRRQPPAAPEPQASAEAPAEAVAEAAPKRRTTRRAAPAAGPEAAATPVMAEPGAEAPARRRTTRKAAPAAEPVAEAPAEAVAEAAPRRRTTRKAAPAAEPEAVAAPVESEAPGSATPRRRTTRKATPAEAPAAELEATQAEAPRRRTTRRTTRRTAPPAEG